jgi:hypothetical protein
MARKVPRRGGCCPKAPTRSFARALSVRRRGLSRRSVGSSTRATSPTLISVATGFWTLADPTGNEVDIATTSAPEQRVLDLQGSMIVDDIWEESRRLDVVTQLAQYRKNELLRDGE